MKKKRNKLYLKSDLDLEDLPLNLKNIRYIIDRIHIRYPMLNKYEIVLIVKSFLEEIRQQLLIGNTINIHNLFYKMRLYTFCRIRKNKLTLNAQVQVSTPGRIKFGSK